MHNDEERTPLVGGKRKCKCTKKTQRIEQFYRKQEELLSLYAEDDHYIITETDGEVNYETARGDNFLSQVVLIVNVGLLIGKAVATYLTSGSSLSIISTLLDSVVDITSGLAIWYATYAIMHTDIFRYPRGRDNLENMSIIFIGIIMGMANFYIIFESISAIVTVKPPPEITIVSLSILVATILIKGILWVFCVKRGSTSSLILAIDQRNDVFTNIVAIGGAVASQWWSYADPIAASLISGYIAYSWIAVILEQMPQLAGIKSTGTEFSRVSRVIIQHSDLIKCIDTLLVYHTGQKVRVEAHVVMDPNTPCRTVHDAVVAPLQAKLERLPFVERAFVHADYECDGYDL